MTTSTLNQKATVAHNTFVEAAQLQSSVKEAQAAKILEAQSTDEKAEFEKARKLAETHETYNTKLSEMSVQALNYLATKLKFVDVHALATLHSRELKKRSIKIIEALAHSKRVDDRALDNVLQRLAAKKDLTLSLQQIQKEMQHETTTQAQYFKTCAEFFHFASYSKSSKELTFKHDAFVLVELMKLYSIEEAKADSEVEA